MQFSAPTREWFAAAFERPTDAQELGWEAIGRGDHTLVLAPTGSGKTLAAFLWALDRLLVNGAGGGCKVLYVSPLKALTYDVARNLRAPLAGIAQQASRMGVELPELRIATRTGDTPSEDRRAMARRPPDILITTPESLYLLLTSQASSLLASVEHVIVDEIHAVASTKRGSHLALSLERLEDLTARSPQRIGLSATQRPLEELARFLGGQSPSGDGRYCPRPVTVVDAGIRKPLELSIVVPVEDMGQLGRPGVGEGWAEAGFGIVGDNRFGTAGSAPERNSVSQDGLGDDLVLRPAGGDGAGGGLWSSSIWPAVYPKLLELIRQHRSTLIFVNSRRLAERLAARLNELAAGDDSFVSGGEAFLGAGAPAELVRAHHGSIAREQRIEIEDALKAGRLPALVATSSLELGIDMGAIDLVIQVEAPTSVASGLQRIGRAGHHVGEPSKGRIFPKFRHDLLVSAVVAERMHQGLVEETRVPRNPLDVLAQQVVASVAASDGAVSVGQVAAMVRRAYPYADLTDESLEGVIDMLAGRYPSDEFAELRPRLVWDRAGGQLSARPGAKMLAVTSGGTIPERGLYGVFTPEGGRVGELDEEMVYESRVGETFLLGATTWRILEITRDRVVVTPAPGVPGKMPFWHGDAVGRPFELGSAIGEFTRTLGERPDLELAESCGLDPLALQNLRAYVEEEREATGGLVPTDRQIVVERFRDELGDWRLAVLSPFGARVHAPWGLAIETRLRRRQGLEAQALWSDDGIIVRLPEADEAPALETVLVDPEEIEELVVEAVGSSALFAARFRESAARSLLLPRRRPGSRTPLWQLRQRAADLLGVASKYGSFPVLLETYRECLQDVFDLPATTRLLRDIQARRVRVAEVELTEPSPFASGLAYAYVAQFMYEGDAPLAERRAQALTLDRRMLAQLLGTDELRELIDPGVLEDVEAELQALAPDRRAAHTEAVADLLRRLGDLSSEELGARCDDGIAEPAWNSLIASKRAAVVRIAGEERIVLAEDAARYRDALGVVPPAGLPEALLAPVPDALLQIVRRWARTHGPFVATEPARRFGLGTVAPVLAQLEASGSLVRGAFRPGGTANEEWCDVEVLRIVRQRSLAALRKEVEPAEVEALGRFLPAWQGIAAVGSDPPGGGLDRLYEVIAQLEGCAIPASVLESDVLPARVRGYEPRMLDELLAAGDLLWVGAGTLGRQDGRVILVRRDNAEVLLPGLKVTGEPDPELAGPLHNRLRDVLSARGACFFRDLRDLGSVPVMTSVSDHDLLEALWDLVWAGEVTCDGMASLRATVGRGGPRSTGTGASSLGLGSRVRARPRPGSLRAVGPPRAQGRWSLLTRELHFELAKTESTLAVATSLLERHGVLTRDAVRAEGVPGGFAGVYPVLKAMEESGRARRGYFVSGLGGAQFALPGAVDRLRASRPGAPGVGAGNHVLILAATDPANVLGSTVPWPVKGPSRVPGAHVVFVDGTASLYVERGGRGLVGLRSPGGGWQEPAVSALARQVETGRWRRLVFQRYPDELDGCLQDAGFVPTPKGLARYPAATNRHPAAAHH